MLRPVQRMFFCNRCFACWGLAPSYKFPAQPSHSFDPGWKTCTQALITAFQGLIWASAMSAVVSCCQLFCDFHQRAAIALQAERVKYKSSFTNEGLTGRFCFFVFFCFFCFFVFFSVFFVFFCFFFFFFLFFLFFFVFFLFFFGFFFFCFLCFFVFLF